MRIRHLVVAGLLVAGPAHGADHLMHVDEVMLNGGNGEQYIELHDTASEPLTLGDPYKLVVYNDAGTMVETITLTGLVAGPTQYYTVGNAAADTTYTTVTFDATLTNALPASGQACFERDNGTKIHCLAWGCPIVTATVAEGAMTPSNGMALSRNATSSLLEYASGTPDAMNDDGTAATACPTTTSDGGVSDSSMSLDSGTNPDGGTDPGGDDDSGCCQSSSPTSAAGGAALSLFVLGLIVRRRRRA